MQNTQHNLLNPPTVNRKAKLEHIYTFNDDERRGEEDKFPLTRLQEPQLYLVCLRLV
jgi:hypothetical protein